MKFAKDLSGYRQRLRQAVVELDLSLPTYSIISNHVHLVAPARNLIKLPT